MTQPLSDQTIALVKATVPALEAHGLDIVREMYSRMFQNPAIRELFNQSHHGDTGSQPRALTGAILAYASNIDNLGALAPAVERIAQKHVGLQILPEHYRSEEHTSELQSLMRTSYAVFCLKKKTIS